MTPLPAVPFSSAGITGVARRPQKAGPQSPCAGTAPTNPLALACGRVEAAALVSTVPQVSFRFVAPVLFFGFRQGALHG
jgi:hypothetical protein